MLANLAKILHDVLLPDETDVFAPFDKVHSRKVSKSCFSPKINSVKLKKSKGIKKKSKSEGKVKKHDKDKENKK